MRPGLMRGGSSSEMAGFPRRTKDDRRKDGRATGPCAPRIPNRTWERAENRIVSLFPVPPVDEVGRTGLLAEAPNF